MNTFVSPSNLTVARRAGPTGAGAAQAAAAGWLARLRAVVARFRQDAAIARDRSAVYALADRYSASQPELAKDLRMAAGRDDGRA